MKEERSALEKERCALVERTESRAGPIGLALLLTIGFAEWAWMKLRRVFILHPSSLILLFAFGVCGWQSACLGSVPSPVFPGSFTGGGLPLAQAASDADWPLVGKIAGIIIVVAALVGAVRYLGGQQSAQTVVLDPPTVTTKKEVRWATWDEVEHLRSEVAEMRADVIERDDQKREYLETKFHEVSRERSVSTARLHERLEATAGALRSDLDQKIEGVRREVHDMPGKLVTLLKETGAIGGRKNG